MGALMPTTAKHAKQFITHDVLGRPGHSAVHIATLHATQPVSKVVHSNWAKQQHVCLAVCCISSWLPCCHFLGTRFTHMCATKYKITKHKLQNYKNKSEVQIVTCSAPSDKSASPPRSPCPALLLTPTSASCIFLAIWTAAFPALAAQAALQSEYTLRVTFQVSQICFLSQHSLK